MCFNLTHVGVKHEFQKVVVFFSYFSILVEGSKEGALENRLVISALNPVSTLYYVCIFFVGQNCKENVSCVSVPETLKKPPSSCHGRS